ncbi:MAG: metallophosphoesterase [Chthonomonadales bacterium]
MPILLSILVACILVLLVWLRRYMFYGEPNRVVVTRCEVPVPGSSPELDGVVLCHLSDLHISREERNRAAITKAVRSVKAHVYLFTGDLIGGSEGVECFLGWLDEMGDAVRPAVMVLGNAEHKEGVDTAGFVDALRRRGVTVLINQTERIAVHPGATLQILGVDDPHTGHEDFQAAACALEPDRFTLVLCHSPDGLADPAFPPADLVLCGHTHGGQIRLPLLPVLWANTRKVRGIVAGMYQGAPLRRRVPSGCGPRMVYVSRGLGTGGCRARLLCPPELAVFTLRRIEGGTLSTR